MKATAGLAAAAVAAALLVHARYARLMLRDLPDRPYGGERAPGPSWLSDAERQSLGWVEPGTPRGRPLRCGPRRPGSVRIGCFGDSFTYGAEVEAGEDFPAQLEILLRRQGYDAEVLNFGGRGHGYVQAYLLWQAATRRGCVDLAVFGPSVLSPERDLTFGQRAPHARFVLEGSGLRLVSAPGASPLEQRRGALRLWPAAEHRLYDRSPPAPLAMWLPSGYVLPNPFYYFPGSPQEELSLIENRVDGLLAAGPVPVLRLRTYAADSAAGVWTARVAQSRGAAYGRPQGHLSAFGNLVLAQQAACALAGRRSCPVDEPRFDPLASLAGAELASHERRGAVLETRSGRPTGPLLAIEQRSASWLDGPLFPLEGAAQGAAVRALWRRNGRSGETVIGAVRRLSGRLAAARVDWDLLYERRQGFRLVAPVETGEIEGLWIGETPLLQRCPNSPLLCPSGEFFTAHVAPAPGWRRRAVSSPLELSGPAGSPLARACGPSLCRR